MSAADRVFTTRKGQGTQAASIEKRLILSTTRKSGSSSGRSRVVEVVHVRSGKGRPAERDPQANSWGAHEEAPHEAFRAKPPQPLPPEMQPAAPEAPPPVVHVMPMWQPSQRQAAEPVDELRQPSAEAVVPRTRRPRLAKATKPVERHCADPFSDDDGTNCMRCGYLVEPSREKRGLLTCSACG